MSLNWNLRSIDNYEDVCYTIAENTNRRLGYSEGDKILSATTEALIWAMAFIGMCEITEANYHEVYGRLAFLEDRSAYRNRVTPDDTLEPVRFTIDEVRQHIGLTTNVSNETRRKWVYRVANQQVEDHITRAKREEKKGATA